MSKVIHPSHYNANGRKECIEEMADLFGVETVFVFELTSAYKYLYRAGMKQGESYEDDMNKCVNYFKMATQIGIDKPEVRMKNLTLYNYIRREVLKYVDSQQCSSSRN